MIRFAVHIIVQPLLTLGLLGSNDTEVAIYLNEDLNEKVAAGTADLSAVKS